jgi:hypothetical protein
MDAAFWFRGVLSGENRQLTGYDAALPGAGLNILHIDEGVTFYNNANAKEYHP